MDATRSLPAEERPSGERGLPLPASDELERLGALALLLCGELAEAEDAAAEAVERVLRHQLSSQIEDVGPYLRRTLVNVVARRGRRRSLERRVLQHLWSREATRSVDDAASDRSDLRRALDALPLEQRAVVVLRYFDDRTESDVAEILGVPIGTVKSRNARALAALRRLLTGGENDG